MSRHGCSTRKNRGTGCRMRVTLGKGPKSCGGAKSSHLARAVLQFSSMLTSGPEVFAVEGMLQFWEMKITEGIREFGILRTRSSRRMAPKMETAVQSWQCRGMGDEECWSTSQMHDTCSLSSESLDWRQLQVCKRQQKTDPSMHRSQTSGCPSWVSRGRNDTDRVCYAHHTHRRMIQGPITGETCARRAKQTTNGNNILTREPIKYPVTATVFREQNKYESRKFTLTQITQVAR